MNFRMRQSPGGVLLLLMTAGVYATNPTSQEQETSRVYACLDDQHGQEMMRAPEQLTQLGRKQRYDQMDDYSEAGFVAEVTAKLKSAAAMALEYDYTKLSFEGQLSRDGALVPLPLLARAVHHWFAQQDN